MAKKRAKDHDDGSYIVCKCECGGNVRGVTDMGQLWTWCDRCSPTEVVKLPRDSFTSPKGGA